MAVPKLLFVTPVHRRPEITRICLEQRVETIKQLADLGIDAQCAVIGNDANLDVARDLGFVTIEAPNVLGRKFNDGHEYAVENGYDYSFPIGSDQVVDPRLLVGLAEFPQELIASRWYVLVHPSGEKCVQFKHKIWAGRIYPTSALQANPRPCREEIMRGCDTSTHRGVTANHPDIGLTYLELDSFEYLNFASGRTQVTSWNRFLRFARRNGAGEIPVPWEGIEERYGAALVEQVKDYYASGRSLKA